MKILHIDGEFFNVKDTLNCGQVFRFTPYSQGYLIKSKDKCCYAYNQDDRAIIECEDGDADYFYRYFDLDTDYSDIYKRAVNSKYKILQESAKYGKGVRILRQNKAEALLSFIISQNNNITRIKGIIEKICDALSEQKSFNGVAFKPFPTIKQLYSKDQNFYKGLSLGYRAEYIPAVAKMIDCGLIEEIEDLKTSDLKKRLIAIKGIGEKVANCALLFGFGRTECFPVDTWLKKVYKEDFKGELTDSKKITAWYENEFYPYGGYFQQYLFYMKRESKNSK